MTTQSSNTVVHVGVTLNGKPTELTTLVGFLPLIPGIYKARLIKDSSPNTYEVQQSYELLLPDGKLRTFYLAGIGQAVCNASAK